jgi:hypothetical protein
MIGLNDALSIYHAEWEMLQKKWEDTRRIWHDDVANHFEKEYWVHWKYIVPEYENAMRDLFGTLERAIDET